MGVQSWYGNGQNQPDQNPHINLRTKIFENLFCYKTITISLVKYLQIFFFRNRDAVKLKENIMQIFKG